MGLQSTHFPRRKMSSRCSRWVSPPFIVASSTRAVCRNWRSGSIRMSGLPIARPAGWRHGGSFLPALPMAGRLLLKSPNHTFRIRALLKEFPGAAYVWLVRDPAEAFFSNRKMWISLFQRYALWDWEISALDRFLARAFCSAANCLTHAVGNVAKERLGGGDFARLTP